MFAVRSGKNTAVIVLSTGVCAGIGVVVKLSYGPKEQKVWTNGVDTIVAYSPEDALERLCAYMGESVEDYIEDYGGSESEFSIVPGDEVIRVRYDNPDMQYSGELDNVSTEEDSSRGEIVLSGTARAWVIAQGLGFLCSTEY